MQLARNGLLEFGERLLQFGRTLNRQGLYRPTILDQLLHHATHTIQHRICVLLEFFPLVRELDVR